MPINRYFSVILDGSGDHIFGAGLNGHGQLALDCQTQYILPIFTRVELPVKFSSVSLSFSEFCIGIAQEDGSLWCWGSNSFRNQENEYPNNSSIPQQIANTKSFIEVSVGIESVLALDKDGFVWSVGSNDSGQLGLGRKFRYENRLVRVETLRNIISVSCGSLHAIVLDSSGNIWSFGDNKKNQLGRSDAKKEFTPGIVDVGKNIVQISSGYEHNLVLDSTGRVWAFGANDAGELGWRKRLPTLIAGLENISKVLCGGSSSYVVDCAGRVFVFGSNSQNQFDMEDYKNWQDTIPIPQEKVLWHNKTIIPGGEHTLVLDEAGNLFYYGHGFGSVRVAHGIQEGIVVQSRARMLKSARNTACDTNSLAVTNSNRISTASAFQIFLNKHYE
jgi:alpha-tubulin suppressor-like RCC1 family protein